MPANRPRRIAVLGAGVMGHGIAEIFAMSGFSVSLYDIEERLALAGKEKIRWSLSKFIEKRRMTQSTANETLGRIACTSDLSLATSECDIIVEAAPEDLRVKRDLFSSVDKLAPKGTVFASNTSTLPISEIASATSREGDFVGMHFFNPPPLMQLLEVVRGEKTSEPTLDFAVSLGKQLGKRVVVCNSDVPGFIVNRILGPLLNEAAWMVSRGEATVESVDGMALYDVRLPMGLFELADFSGIDTIVKAGDAVASRDPANVSVAPLFRKKVEEGSLGRKSGVGFYTYSSGDWKRPKIERSERHLAPLQVFAPAVNAAAWLLRNQVCSEDDLETSTKLGLGFPEGILKMASEWGFSDAVEVLRMKSTTYGKFYEPDPKLIELASDESSSVRTFTPAAGLGLKGEVIIVRREPPLAWIILNRPHRLNSFTSEMVEDLASSLKELDQEPGIRVVVIRGEGERAFSAGADLMTFTDPSPIRVFAQARSWYDSFSLARRLSKPVIAAVNGLALGGGLELALQCDFRLAASDSELGLTESKLGLIPGAGGTQRLAKLVGLPWAKEMIFFGLRVPAEAALSHGLVDRVFQKEGFEAEVREFALALAKQPPISLKLAKQALELSLRASEDSAQPFDAASFGLLVSTEDASEGISAMMEKREPEFKGQ